MSLNKYMHPRNAFAHKKPNFKELASKYDFFEKLTTKDEHDRVTLDFKKPSCLAALAKCLLLEYFELDVVFPLDRLVPTIPLRLNYILWIEDILQNSFNPGKSGESCNLIDIGAGASCIYALLGAKKNSWNFVTTETDEKNISCARINVLKNNLDSKIKVVPTTCDGPLLSSVLDNPDYATVNYDIVLSNPPFFTGSVEAAGINRNESRLQPKSCSTAYRDEAQIKGGEVTFVMKLAKESLQYKDRVKVFTVMLGKKKSLPPLKDFLHRLGVLTTSTYEMCQGRVMRWGFAWSFDNEIKFPKSEFKKKKLKEKPPLTWVIPRDLPRVKNYSINAFYEILKHLFKDLKISCIEQKTKLSQGGGTHLLITAYTNTWSHQRRRKRQMKQQLQDSTPDVSSNQQQEEVDKVSHTDDQSPLPLSQSFSHSKKRPHSTPDTEMALSCQSIEEEEPSSKLLRLDELVCEEGGAWEDASEQQSPSIPEESSAVHSSDGNAILVKATMWVTGSSGGVFLGKENLVMQMCFVDGSDKESMNQIFTYLKNQITAPLPQADNSQPESMS